MGFYTALVSNALLIVGIVGGTGLFWLFVLGFWGMVVGLVLLGSATVRAGMLPRWYGWLLVVSLPISSVLARVLVPVITLRFQFWFGLFLLVLGYVLWSRRGAAAEQLSRVS